MVKWNDGERFRDEIRHARARPHPEERACSNGSAKSNGRARVSKDEDGRGARRSCFETHRSAVGLWKRLRSPPAAMLLSMRANQPAAVGNDRPLRSIVSGLLFTTDGATPTCRAVSARAGGGRHALGVSANVERGRAPHLRQPAGGAFRPTKPAAAQRLQLAQAPARKIRISFSGEPACSGDKKIPRRVCPAGGRQLKLVTRASRND